MGLAEASFLIGIGVCVGMAFALLTPPIVAGAVLMIAGSVVNLVWLNWGE